MECFKKIIQNNKQKIVNILTGLPFLGIAILITLNTHSYLTVGYYKYLCVDVPPIVSLIVIIIAVCIAVVRITIRLPWYDKQIKS